MSVKNNGNLESVLPLADHGQTTVGGRGEKERKRDESKRCGELAHEGVNVRGRQSERDEVAKMLRRRGREMWASDDALLWQERVVRTERKERDGMENSN